MDIDKKMEELRKEFNEKIEELKREYKGKNEKWIPKGGEIYYYLAMDFSVSSCVNLLDSIDRTRFKFSKIFKTKEEAQEYASYLKARKEYSYEFSKEEWEDSKIEKYLMCYNYQIKKFRIFCCTNCKDINSIYFKTRKKAQEFIENYKKQILKFEFGIEG